MLYDGDEFECGGLSFRVNFPPDDDSGPPWEQCEGYGIVSDWTTRSKRAGELVLNADRWGGQYRYYDFAASVKLALADGWNAPPYDIPGETKRQRAARATLADYEFLRGWCQDGWCYVGVSVVRIDSDGDPIGPTSSVWGIESCCDDYLTETAHDLADEIAAEHNNRLAAEIEASRPDMVPA